MTQPTLIERFADNGEHSHWELVDTETHETLWSGDSAATPPPQGLAWVKIGDDLFQIDEQLDNFIRATCGSSYRVELRKADTKWVVNNAMNGWGNNCYDEWMDKEVTLLYESPKEPAAPQTDAVGAKIPIDILDDLKDMSNKYIVCNSSYVIPKSVIDLYIEYLESSRL